MNFDPQPDEKFEFDGEPVDPPSSHVYQGIFRVPSHMDYGLLAYVYHGQMPGDFLRAVITNDFKEAVGRADLDNLRNLPAFIYWFYNQAPAPCWGSKEKMIAWHEGGGLLGVRRRARAAANG